MMTDEHLSVAIRREAEKLNSLIEDAFAQGVEVKLEVKEVHYIDRRTQSHLYVEITKRL